MFDLFLFRIFIEKGKYSFIKFKSLFFFAIFWKCTFELSVEVAGEKVTKCNHVVTVWSSAFTQNEGSSGIKKKNLSYF